MTTTRKPGHAPRTQALATELNALNVPCIGCPGCEGLCQALIDAVVVPATILKGRDA